MKTLTYNVYKFSELSDKAKQRAKDCFAEMHGYNWSDDALESLKSLAGHFGGKLADWSVDWFNCTYSSAKFDMPETEPDAVAAKLAMLGEYDPITLRGRGSCVLTGFCADEDAIDGFRLAYARGERDLSTLMQSAFQTWLKAAQADCEAQYTDEVFAETAEANGWEYEEDGTSA